MTHASGGPLPTPPQVEGKRPALGRRLFAFLMLLLALFFLGWQIAQAGPRDLVTRLVTVPAATLVLILALTLLRYIVASARLAALTRLLTPVRWSPFLSIVLLSQLLGAVIPGVRVGATVLRAHLAARRFEGGTALHLGPNLLDQLALATSWILVALALAPALAIGSEHPIGAENLIYLLLAVAGIVSVFIVFKRSRHRISAWLTRPRPGRRGRLAEAAATTIEGMGTLVDEPRALTIGLVGGIAFVILAGLAQWVALTGLGEPFPWWNAILAVVVGTTIGTASGTPGGLGVTEAAQVAFLGGQGVPVANATAAVLLARGAYYLLIVVGGLLALLGDFRRKRRKPA